MSYGEKDLTAFFVVFVLFVVLLFFALKDGCP